MWSIELPTGELLELPEGMQLAFELQNSVFSSNDTSVLPGSFSFPVTLPATGENRRVFNFPELPSSSNAIREIEEVWIMAQGVRMFFGTLQVREAGSGIQINIIANPLVGLKNVKLNELDLGGERPFNQVPYSPANIMDSAADDPDAHDFVFCELYAPNFYSEPPSFAPAIVNQRTINRYDRSASGFAVDGGPISPQVKVKYLLDQMIENEADGWAWNNDFQEELELSRLYLYNHTDLWDDLGEASPSLPRTFNLKDHVSATPASEFLKGLSSLFCLGVFTNIFTRKISIISLQKVLARPAAHDWTNYAIQGASVIYEDSEAPELFCHANIAGQRQSGDVSDQIFLPDLSEMTHYETRTELDADIDAGPGVIDDGYYYVVTDESVYYVRTFDDGTGQYRRFQKRQRIGVYYENEPVYKPMLPPMLQFSHPSLNYLMPEWRDEGSYLTDADEDGETYMREYNENPLAVFFYRGYQDAPGANAGVPVPYASIVTNDPAGTGTAQLVTSGSSEGNAEYSLLWAGDNGLYQKFFSRWHEMLKNGKPVTYQILLPIHELVKFKFEDKVRILNMEYFVKSIKINRLNTDGRFLIEASLFSVI